MSSIGWLFVLDLVLMSALLALAIALFSMGLAIPANKLGDLQLSPALLFAIIIIAPVAEETGFRSWLSGRPQHIWSFLWAAIAAAAGLIGAGFAGLSPEYSMMLAAALGLLAAIIAAITIGKRKPYRFFKRYFGWFLALSTGLFAIAHLSNYDNANPAFLLLVIPQAIAGLIFAFTRVNYGLWASILLHALHNGTFIALAMLGKSFG